MTKVAAFFSRDFTWGTQVLHAYWVGWGSEMRNSAKGLAAAAEHARQLQQLLTAAGEELEQLQAASWLWGSGSHGTPPGADGEVPAAGKAKPERGSATAPVRTGTRGLGPDATPIDRLGLAVARSHARASAELLKLASACGDAASDDALLGAAEKYKAITLDMTAAASALVADAGSSTKRVAAAWNVLARLQSRGRSALGDAAPASAAAGPPSGAARDGRGGVFRRPRSAAPPGAAHLDGSADPWLAEARFAACCRVALAARRRCLARLGHLFEKALEAEKFRGKVLSESAELVTTALDRLGGSTGKEVRDAASLLGHGPDGLRARLERRIRPMLGAMLSSAGSAEYSDDDTDVDPRAARLGFAADGTDTTVDGDILGRAVGAGAAGGGSSAASSSAAAGTRGTARGVLSVPSVLAFVGMVPADTPSPLDSPMVVQWGAVELRSGGIFRRWSPALAVVTALGWLHLVTGKTEAVELGANRDVVAELAAIGSRTGGVASAKRPEATASLEQPAEPSGVRALGVPCVFPAGRAFAGLADARDEDVPALVSDAAELVKPWKSVDLASLEPPGERDEEAGYAEAMGSLERRGAVPSGSARVSVEPSPGDGAGALKLTIRRPGLFTDSVDTVVMRAVVAEEGLRETACELWLDALWRAGHAARQFE